MTAKFSVTQILHVTRTQATHTSQRLIWATYPRLSVSAWTPSPFLSLPWTMKPATLVLRRLRKVDIRAVDDKTHPDRDRLLVASDVLVGRLTVCSARDSATLSDSAYSRGQGQEFLTSSSANAHSIETANMCTGNTRSDESLSTTVRRRDAVSDSSRRGSQVDRLSACDACSTRLLNDQFLTLSKMF